MRHAFNCLLMVTTCTTHITVSALNMHRIRVGEISGECAISGASVTRETHPHDLLIQSGPCGLL
jgi:hypothetical protein